MVWQFRLANKAKANFDDVQVTEAGKLEQLAKLLEALSKLPAGDRLIFYGIVLLVIGGLVAGWIDLSSITGAGKAS